MDAETRTAFKLLLALPWSVALSQAFKTNNGASAKMDRLQVSTAAINYPKWVMLASPLFVEISGRSALE